MKYTDRLSLKKPEETENVLVEDLNGNADKIDSSLGLPVYNAATKPVTPFDGQAVYESDTGRIMVYVGGRWKYLTPESHFIGSMVGDFYNEEVGRLHHDVQSIVTPVVNGSGGIAFGFPRKYTGGIIGLQVSLGDFSDVCNSIVPITNNMKDLDAFNGVAWHPNGSRTPQGALLRINYDIWGWTK